MTHPQITAIIPAYNEQETIADVVRVLVTSPYISETFVISDGSTDKTAFCAREAGAIVHELPRKGGKGEAMLHALIHTQAPIVAFFDADLRGLTTEHVEQLVLPVINGSRVMNVALRDRGRFVTWINSFGPLIAGERVVLRRVVENVPAQYMKGFMIEIALNYFCRSRGFSYGAVKLSGLMIRTKVEKVGFRLAVLQYIHMTFQVVKAMVLVRVAHWRGTF